MTDRSTNKPLVALRGTVAIAITLVMGVAISQTMPKEGNYDYISCWSGTSNDIQFSKTHTFGNYEFITNNRTSPPGGLFDMTVARCVGLYNMFDGKGSNSSFCEGVDKDGEKFVVRNTIVDGKPVQEGIAGTGKYEGMTRIGTTEMLGRFPTIKAGVITGCARQTGTYKMK
jgi:hypothetical protein